MWMNIIVTQYFKNFTQRDNKNVPSAMTAGAYRNDVIRTRIPLNMIPKKTFHSGILTCNNRIHGISHTIVASVV